jgi:hypothetical protein
MSKNRFNTIEQRILSGVNRSSLFTGHIRRSTNLALQNQSWRAISEYLENNQYGPNNDAANLAYLIAIGWAITNVRTYDNLAFVDHDLDELEVKLNLFGLFKARIRPQITSAKIDHRTQLINKHIDTLHGRVPRNLQSDEGLPDFFSSLLFGR